MTEATRLPLTVIPCTEYEHVWVDDPRTLMGDGQNLIIDSNVDGRDAFSVDFVKGRMRIRASSLVGVIPLNDHVVLKVRPRVPVANLTRMVHETGHKREVLRAFRDYTGTGTASDWIMDMYAEALLDGVGEILNRGLYRVYERREADGSFPHGRIVFPKTVARHASRGINHRVTYQWFERTADNPANRCIKAALMKVHAHLTTGQQARGYRTMVNRIAGQLAAFEDVPDDPTRGFLNDPDVTGTRALPATRDYYRNALDLALMIVNNTGLSLEKADGTDVRLPSLLIEMNSLFESYVRVVLQRASVQRGWPVEVLDGNKDGHVPLYEAPLVLPEPFGVPMPAMFPAQRAKATPDIVLRMPDGTVALVAEVKNTAKGGVLPDRDEVNQAVTYAVRYGLKQTLLIRPLKEGTPGLTYCGNIGGVNVFDFKVDLGASDLDRICTEFTDTVASLMSTDATVPAQPLIAG